MTEEEKRRAERLKKYRGLTEESDFPETDPRLQVKKEKPKKHVSFRKVRRTLLLLLLIPVVFVGILFLADYLSVERPLAEAEATGDSTPSVAETMAVYEAPDIDVELIPVNDYSRGGELLEDVTAIVVHYTGNPGTTAEQNRSYYASLAVTHEARVSSHFVIGMDGKIIQCIPLSEQSYASNDRNTDTISIECCHPDDTGEFTEETYDSLVYLCAYLVGKYDLQPTDVIRHYDVTGKECPRYFVTNEDAWQQFLSDVESYIAMYGKEKTQE